ncbi:MAG: glycosyltransferase family 2 protein [Phycisphaeraceae bacterium]|nr:glycosyltransferase family 2 protein [Phycisphaeraceae bacterium]
MNVTHTIPGLKSPVRVDVDFARSHPTDTDRSAVEVSIVMPCLNEAQTIGRCVEAARRCIESHGLVAEVIVADNGSTDGSQAIAERAGARVVAVASKGYGNALLGGFNAARGKYLIMGDSDLSYDFGESMKFVERLREGYDLVMGNRFDFKGGGGIKPGAMPFKNRYLGNPLLSWIGRVLFNCPVRDFHCGLRAFTREAFESLRVRTTGMEFASEIVIKATLRRMRITEVPITLHKDGRDRPPHLRPWRDGWRHLRFMLCLSPRWTLFVPGLLLVLIGAALGASVAFGPLVVAGVSFDVHTLIAASLAVIVGSQWVGTALLMRAFALESEIGPPSPRLDRWVRHFTLEKGLLAGVSLCVIGMIPIAWVLLRWWQSGFGPLDVAYTLRPMVIGATSIALGAQALLISVLAAMFRARRLGRE